MENSLQNVNEAQGIGQPSPDYNIWGLFTSIPLHTSSSQGTRVGFLADIAFLFHFIPSNVFITNAYIKYCTTGDPTTGGV